MRVCVYVIVCARDYAFVGLPGCVRACVCVCVCAVSYTHLTLPTIDDV